jgi:hypothetical protein
MAIANVGVTGNGLHFSQNGTAVLYVELSLSLRDCHVFPITSVTVAILYAKNDTLGML